MIAYRGLVTNLSAILAIAVLGWHGCTAEVAYLSLAGIAGAHAWRGAQVAKAAAPTQEAARG